MQYKSISYNLSIAIVNCVMETFFFVSIITEIQKKYKILYQNFFPSFYYHYMYVATQKLLEII